MTTRSLTKKYVEIRNSAKTINVRKNSEDRDSYDERGLLKLSPDSSAWKASKQNELPPEWVDTIELVGEDITKIQTKLSELDVLFKRRARVDFQTDEAGLEREIEMKTNDLTRIFHHAEAKLKQFGSVGSEELSTAEKSVRKNLQMSMAKKLQTLSTTFRVAQRNYMTNLRGQSQASTSETLEKLGVEDVLVTTENESEFEDTGFTKKQMMVVEETEQETRRRDAEIVRIAKSIEELAAIFRELAVLVIDQGTLLDRIDYNMESAVENVRQGKEQLDKAEEHQKNAMSVRCIILLVVLIIVMLGVLIWKHSSANK
mmetsp:Transcript_28214/g.40178  ORF Transcript_28214/g.40178 Transcript_28214/m.40178 type:complete len:315 (-) Transcript_28214:339-1283(-)